MGKSGSRVARITHPLRRDCKGWATRFSLFFFLPLLFLFLFLLLLLLLLFYVTESVFFLFLFCLCQEVDEVVLPDGGLGVGAVAAGGVGDGEEDELGVGHLGDHLFGDA